ncbi:MAG: hypothetical protein HY976_02830 [Candidatus Kerfeldbacteria bacterium]|nr:hypothetical protein [Candidatus Kerfeldbacteria bacterium]
MIKQRKETTKDRLPLWKRLNISERGLRIVLAAVIATGGFGYLALTTQTATNGLQIKGLNDRLSELSSRRAELQADVDRMQSFQHLDNVTQRLDLVRVSKVDVVGSPAGSVAAR